MQSIINWFTSKPSDQPLSYNLTNKEKSKTYTLALSVVKPDEVVKNPLVFHPHHFVRVKIAKGDGNYLTVYGRVDHLSQALGTSHQDIVTMSAETIGKEVEKRKEVYRQCKEENIAQLVKKGFKEFEGMSGAQRRAFDAIHLMTEEDMNKLSVLFSSREQRKRIFNTLLSIGEQIASHSGDPNYHIYKPATADSYAFLMKDGEAYFNDEWMDFGESRTKTVSSGRRLKDLELVAWQEVKEERFRDKETGNVTSNLDWIKQEQSHLQKLESSRAQNVAPPFSVCVRVQRVNAGNVDRPEQKMLLVQKVFMYDGREISKYRDERQMIHCYGDVANGLDHMHANNLVHGDVNPSNFAFDGEKWVVIDLGSTVLKGEAQNSNTPQYLAPESHEKATFEQDSYALGVSLFESVTGLKGTYSNQPFSKATPEDIQTTMARAKKDLEEGLSHDERGDRIKLTQIRKQAAKEALFALKSSKTVEELTALMHERLMELRAQREKEDLALKVGETILSTKGEVNQYIQQFLQTGFYILKNLSRESEVIEELKEEIRRQDSELEKLLDRRAVEPPEAIKIKQTLIDWSRRLMDPDPSKRPSCKDVASAFTTYRLAQEKYEKEKGRNERGEAVRPPVLGGPPEVLSLG